MSEEITDLQYVEELIADFGLQPSNRIAELIGALGQEEDDEEEED